MAIRHRKNSLFFKTQHGADVADVYMTILCTCELNGVNPFEYPTALMRHSKDVAADPESWLPWNYREALARITGSQGVAVCRPLTNPPGPSVKLPN